MTSSPLAAGAAGAGILDVRSRTPSASEEEHTTSASISSAMTGHEDSEPSSPPSADQQGRRDEEGKETPGLQRKKSHKLFWLRKTKPRASLTDMSTGSDDAGMTSSRDDILLPELNPAHIHDMGHAATLTFPRIGSSPKSQRSRSPFAGRRMKTAIDGISDGMARIFGLTKRTSVGRSVSVTSPPHASGERESDARILENVAVFNHLTTSSKNVKDLTREVGRVLTANKVRHTVAGYIIHCEMGLGPSDLLVWEMEICRLAQLDRLHGIKFRRIGGDMWTYKNTIDSLVQQMKL
eukprot:Opistho-2@74454